MESWMASFSEMLFLSAIMGLSIYVSLPFVLRKNLTEGLVFGALGVAFGFASGAALVVLIGFLLQNITEGFPIASPFLDRDDKKLGVIFSLFLLGGIPTIIG